MPRHDLNPFPLFVGAIFCGVGVASLAGHWSWVDLPAGWLVAFVLVGLGIAGIVSATGRARRRDAESRGGYETDR